MYAQLLSAGSDLDTRSDLLEIEHYWLGGHAIHYQLEIHLASPGQRLRQADIDLVESEKMGRIARSGI